MARTKAGARSGRRRPMNQGAPRLSLVIPAFNEERRIEASLERIGAFLAGLGTTRAHRRRRRQRAGRAARRRARAWRRCRTSVERHACCGTRRTAVRAPRCAPAAWRRSGRYVAFIDADLATPPEDLRGLLAALEAGADVAIGVRTQGDGSDMRDRRRLRAPFGGHGCSRWRCGLLLLPGMRRQPVPAEGVPARGGAAPVPPAAHRDLGVRRRAAVPGARLGLTVAKVPVRWQAVEGSHLRLSRSVGELVNLARIRWLHRGVR